MGAECSKLRQPMRAILALSRAQLLLIVVTRSRDLSRECHVTKHKTPARSNFPMSNFENFGTIQFSSSRSTSRGLCPKNFEKRAHPSVHRCNGHIQKAHDVRFQGKIYSMLNRTICIYVVPYSISRLCALILSLVVQ